MKKLASFFVVNQKLTLIVTLFMFIYGIRGYKSMIAETYPNVDFATTTIETVYPGATPKDIEVKITKPIEDEIRTVSGLKDVRSVSQAGQSKITIRIDMDNPKVDVQETVSDLQTALERVTDLPSDLTEQPEFTELKAEEIAAIEIAVTGENGNKRKRNKTADLLKEDIEDIRSVKAVNLYGYQEREFNILLDSKKLETLHMSVDEVTKAVISRNINIPGGDLELGKEQKLVTIDNKVETAEELGETVVRSSFSGKKIRLKDIASVMDGEEDATIKTRYNGKAATLLSVQKKAGADTLELVRDVKEILKTYEKRYKNDLEFFIYTDEGIKVKDKLAVLSTNGVTGIVVVILVLMFFMPGRIGLMVAISLPTSLFAAVGLMPSFGLTFNSISILALIIAMGMLVDNAVVISEEYIRRREEGQKSLDAAIDSVVNLWIPITATAMTTVSAFLPMLATTGIMGRFITPIPIVVTAALLFCLLECFILLPMRLHFVGRNIKLEKKTDETNGWYEKFAKKFEKLMQVVVKHRYISALGGILIIAFSFVVMIVFNKFILFPAEQTEEYDIRVELPVNSSLEYTDSIAQKVSKRVEETIEKKWLQETIAFSGYTLVNLLDQRGQVGDNVFLIKVMASDYAKYNVHYTDFLKELRKLEIPEAETIIIEEKINGPPVGTAVNVTFRSSNDENLQKVVDMMIKKLEEVDGVFDEKIDDVFGPDEVVVDLNNDYISRLGLSASQIGNTIRTALTGSIVSNVTLLNKEIDLKVEFGNVSKSSIEDLKKITVTDPKGNLVPLSLLADFKIKDGAAQVKRYDYKRAKTVMASVDVEKITSIQANKIVSDYWKEIQDEFHDVSVVYGGEQESTKESLNSLASAMVLAVIGIYGIMVYIFGSYLAPALIVTTIPLGLLGISVSFYLHDRPISFLAMIGIIGLAGIIVNNGIILIDYINQMKEEGKMSLQEILVHASVTRLKPVMASSITTMGGLFPTAYGIGGSDSMLVPITMAMAWGLTTGTILTLIWVPAGFGIIEDFMEKVSNTRVYKYLTSEKY
ncbi:MAG: hypothetical protein CME60_09375 [Halobacteriovoraceae bacterium]|nr:hypothetical protein [Halobacteriovoraceae bacterium]